MRILPMRIVDPMIPTMCCACGKEKPLTGAVGKLSPDNAGWKNEDWFNDQIAALTK